MKSITLENITNGEKRMNTKKMSKDVFCKRFQKHSDELKWLYMELYSGNEWAYNSLVEQLRIWYEQRDEKLKKLDSLRETDTNWYKKNDLVGMMMYADAFAGNLSGVLEKLNYLKKSNINYLHLMPVLDTPEGKSDGGYAVSDFRRLRSDLGDMDDLKTLAMSCHDLGISICLDFVMNHTSDEHEWALRARAGEQEYRDRYYFYDNYDVPSQFERDVPQVFPTTAPGNFTWLEDIGKFVMTSFYPYQWDLNYWNPVVFNEMVYNMLNLANHGVDIIRLDAVPYIWKQLGTNCRNLPKVHTIVRLMRIITEIVCPGVLLLGEVVMEPSKVVPYFGTVEKPECHMLYNVTTMATTWNTVATGDVRLLRNQMDILSRLPKQYIYLNYLRCHDDIGWGLDYLYLMQFGIGEVSHKKFLNDFLSGKCFDSFGRGELYNDDPTLGDARLCGTTASLCGIEKAIYEDNKEELKLAIRYDIMLHAYMLFQSGIPVIYSGDEIGQCNDYGYHNNPQKWSDSRYLHRGAFDWEKEKNIYVKDSVEQQIYEGLIKLENIRSKECVYNCEAQFHTIDTWDDGILGIVRSYQGEEVLGLFNFSRNDRTAWVNLEGNYKDLMTDKIMYAKAVDIPSRGFFLLKKVK